MNRKQLLLVLAALVILGSAGLILINQHRESWNGSGTKMGDKVLPEFHPNDVAAIHIKDANGELNLIHKNDLWRVQEREDYPANFGRISDILIKLQGLKVVEAETVGASQLAHVSLDEPGTSRGGTLVEFKDGRGKTLTALLLGRKHMREQGESSHSITAGEADGRYILVRSDPKNVLLVPDALASLAPSPEIWLSKDFFKVERPKSITLTATNETDSWKLTRENDSAPWTLADGKPGEFLDTNKASRIASVLNSVTFSDVIPADAGTAADLEKPMTMEVETFDGFAYTLKIARVSENSDHLTVAVTARIPAGQNEKLQEKLRQEQALASWVYVVNSWILDPLTQTRAQLLQGYRDEKLAAESKAATEASTKKKEGWTPGVIH